MNIKKIGLITAGLFAGALLTWVLINWLPSTTILVGALAGAYIVKIKVK